MIKNKRILITGGAGFIGSHLIELLWEKNQITVFDNGHRNAYQFLPGKIKKSVNFVKGNIQDELKVEKVTKNQDIIFHLAAIAGVSSYESDPLTTINVNLLGTAILLKNLSLRSFDQVILLSSSEVYGDQTKAVKENDSTIIGPAAQPRWSYAVSKLASDHLAMAYFLKNEMPITIVRPFNIYGPRQMGEGAVCDMIKSAILNHKIYVYGNGQQKRAWCFIDDLMTAFASILATKPRGKIINIGNPGAYLSISALAKKIQAIQKDAEIVIRDPKSNAEIKNRIPNLTLAKNLLKFKPSFGLDEGLVITFSWYRENIARLKD